MDHQSQTALTDRDDELMRIALAAAGEALALDEVPIGACLVDAEGNVIASGSNRTIIDSDPTGHAEIVALRAAGVLLGNYRLPGTTLYTTIEPCVMCAGALVNARVSRLVYGAPDERFGAAATLFRICDDERLNHRMSVTAGVLEDECRALVQTFFRSRR